MQRFSNSSARNIISTHYTLCHAIQTAIYNHHALNEYMYEIELRWLLLHNSIGEISQMLRIVDRDSSMYLNNKQKFPHSEMVHSSVAINFQQFRIWGKLDFRRQSFLFWNSWNQTAARILLKMRKKAMHFSSVLLETKCIGVFDYQIDSKIEQFKIVFQKLNSLCMIRLGLLPIFSQDFEGNLF